MSNTVNNDNYFHIPQIKKRNRKGKRFEILAASSLVVSILFLCFFLFDMIRQGYPAFQQTYINIPVEINEETKENPYAAIERKYFPLASRAWLRDMPNMLNDNPNWMNTKETRWVLASAEADQYMKGHYNRLKEKEIKELESLKEAGNIKLRLNIIFLTNGDSKIPEYSGIQAAIIGTILTMLVTMAISVPIGVMTAIYLEEFAPDNKLTQIIEVNINNLAAIPSILFGLLGLAIFINFFGVPRSSPLVGGMTLALMSLPIIIVSSKAALKSIPDTIRQAGFGLGLTRWQIVRDHVLPLAMPGMMTGAIIALAQAMGETAPLIIVGMIAFIPDAATSIMEAATVMPAQIFTWSGMPERAYVERTAAGILVLLSVLLTLNAIAIYLRKKYTKTW